MNEMSPVLKTDFREFCSNNLVLRQIDDLFELAGIKQGELDSNRNISGQRRQRVEEFYSNLDFSKESDIAKFLQVIEFVLLQTYISEDNKIELRNICTNHGLEVVGNKIIKISNVQESKEDLFKMQFPVGLPFGLSKPNFSIKAEKGGQSVKFELNSGNGIIWDNVYPDFSFNSFQVACGIQPSTNLALKKSLLSMNQTDNEKVFFQTYAKHFNMADSHVPMLVPQAWIQWHSKVKRNLRSFDSSHADELYRVDFVAFWNNQRYAILIDDISHYAKKEDKYWLANEEAYSKRLKEDRKLQTENWRVFRVSNWELRDPNKHKEILLDLQIFIGFD